LSQKTTLWAASVCIIKFIYSLGFYQCGVGMGG
jgi:hypothetical protein